MQIGAVARQAGVSAQTLRYYERRRLLTAPPRTVSGYRAYPASVVRRVRFIKQAQQLGNTLREIRRLLALRDQPGGNATPVRAVATAKIERLSHQIERLTHLRDTLARAVAQCPCGDALHPDCLILDTLGDNPKP
jgi:DNA-binding transcriptional MerR regulator